MARTQEVILTNMCMISDGDGKVLMQIRADGNSAGAGFPGGHVEPGESITASVIREVYEETGIEIKNPLFCGLTHFYTSDGTRYLVFLYKANEFTGELRSSSEGEAIWVEREKLSEIQTVRWLSSELLEIFESEKPRELWYHDGTYNIL